MSNIFEQLVLAARSQRDTDGGGWMQLLVIVVIAAFYGISSILKSKADKRQLDDEPMKPLRRQGPKKPAGPGLAERFHREKLRREIQSEPSLRTKIIGEEDLADIEGLEMEQLQHLSPKSRKVEAQLQKNTKAVGHPILKMDIRKPSRPSKLTEAPPTDLFSLGFEEADELKRAILYAEILGKPVSMR